MKVYWLFADGMGGYQYFDSEAARKFAEDYGDWCSVYPDCRQRGEDDVDESNLIEILNRHR